MANITRTIFTTNAKAVVIENNAPQIINISVAGHKLTEKEIIKACKSSGIEAKAVYDITETSRLYSMDESTFIKYATDIGEGRI